MWKLTPTSNTSSQMQQEIHWVAQLRKIYCSTKPTLNCKFLKINTFTSYAAQQCSYHRQQICDFRLRCSSKNFVVSSVYSLKAVLAKWLRKTSTTDEQMRCDVVAKRNLGQPSCLRSTIINRIYSYIAARELSYFWWGSCASAGPDSATAHRWITARTSTTFTLQSNLIIVLHSFPTIFCSDFPFLRCEFYASARKD